MLSRISFHVLIRQVPQDYDVSSATPCLFNHVIYAISLSLYPFTERYAQPYFFSCLIRQMVNTRTNADLSAAVQNALQTLLPRIREEIREEFRTGSGSSNAGGNPPPGFAAAPAVLKPKRLKVDKTRTLELFLDFKVCEDSSTLEDCVLQDIYTVGSENRPPMLNKDNYVPWSSRIIIYARSRPNGKMIVNSIENGPYVRRMIATPGEPDLPVPVPELFHEQTDEELTETDIKRMDAFQLTAATNNNQRTSSNPRNRQIAQPIMNMSQDRQTHNVGGIANQSGYGNVVATRVESTGIGNRARLSCSLLKRKKQEFNFKLNMVAAGDLDEIEEVNANCILMANLQQASTSSTQLDKAPVYDTDGSAEVQLIDNCYDNEIFNMFTQEEQYTDLLEPIPEPHLVLQNDNHVTSIAPSMVQSVGTVKTSFAPNEETPTHQETVYRLVHTARTRRPQPKGKTRNAKIPSASKSSEVKKNVTVEEHRRTLLLSKNQKTMSSECKNIKLAIRNDKSETVCDTLQNTGLEKKQVGSEESLAPKPRLPRFSLKWSPSGRSFDLKGKLVAPEETNYPNDDKAYTSNPQEQMRKQFPNSTVFLGRRNTCFIRDLDGVDLLKGNRSTNLYIINLYEMASASPICLMARVTPTKSWLWHQRLSHLNFDTINDLAKNDLVSGLPKFKYSKEHLCPSCEQGKSKRASHPPKPVLNLKQRLYLLHMDLCGSIVGITYETSAAKSPQQNGVVERKNRTLVEAARTIVYNQRTKKIIEKMNITFDELSAMAFEQNNSRPELQSMTSRQISSELELTYAPSTITPQRPSERDLDILFEPLHNKYLGGQPEEAPRAIPAVPVIQNLQVPNASMSFQDSVPVPTNSSNTPVSSHNVDATSQQHAQQQRNLTPSPTASAADNVPNAVFERDLLVNPFGTPSTESVVSSTQYVDPSNMYTFYQLYTHDYQWTKDHPLEQVIGEPSQPVLTRNQLKTDGDICIYALTVSIMEPKTVKEALTDPAWIDSMQEELHQFIRLDDSGFELTGFSDADYAGCKDTFKITSGGA
nr:integrase, catalytic region, zinc finger, CCHC-type, peptidase aspartic, catalytic [Tanacetum cinerariifolium]